jgi:hypothetical protein
MTPRGVDQVTRNERRFLMRKLSAWLYVTLDGVVEAPEKWVMPDEEMFEEQTADYAASDALLLGRRTYEVFAASWLQRGSDVPNADWMKTTPCCATGSSQTIRVARGNWSGDSTSTSAGSGYAKTSATRPTA